ncbi:LAMI_0D01948g1_1 [Lachancea mirantina]|uniref:LAMI_0D01948g1_1 n=1 Tax=Lachancea mirantina TaxID=1230905 RepID=A0A1G4J913_9SACH|nr:LAMI_0D01948g1_1 [Lachancea mirantina]
MNGRNDARLSEKNQSEQEFTPFNDLILISQNSTPSSHSPTSPELSSNPQAQWNPILRELSSLLLRREPDGARSVSFKQPIPDTKSQATTASSNFPEHLAALPGSPSIESNQLSDLSSHKSVKRQHPDQPTALKSHGHRKFRKAIASTELVITDQARSLREGSDLDRNLEESNVSVKLEELDNTPIYEQEGDIPHDPVSDLNRQQIAAIRSRVEITPSGPYMDDSNSSTAEQIDITPKKHQQSFLSFSRLRALVEKEVGEKNLKIPKTTINSLRQAHDGFLKNMVLQLQAVVGSEHIWLDKKNLIKIFSNYGILPRDADREALFELCSRFLSTEDLNRVEITLFGR